MVGGLVRPKLCGIVVKNFEESSSRRAPHPLFRFMAASISSNTSKPFAICILLSLPKGIFLMSAQRPHTHTHTHTQNHKSQPDWLLYVFFVYTKKRHLKLCTSPILRCILLLQLLPNVRKHVITMILLAKPKTLIRYV